MIEGLKNIGKISLAQKGFGKEEAIAILVENPVNENYNRLVVIHFNQINNQLNFGHIQTQPADGANYLKYLYKRKGSQGANYTPTAPVAGKGIEGTFKNRILGWAKTADSNLPIVGVLAQSILRDSETILAELQQKEKEEGLANCILTVAIDGKFLGEYEEFRQYFLEAYYAKKSEVANNNGFCSMCGQQGFVMGNEKPWAFYSLDKPGFIASGFDSKKGWKNYPICRSCSLLVEEGKQHVSEHLSFRFAGIPYFLIPKSITNNKEVLEDTLLFLEQERKRRLTMVDLKRLADDEDDILSFAAEQDDHVNYNFLFYHQPPGSSKFSILLYLQDVLPSAIRRLFEAKAKVERPSIFKNVYKENDTLKHVDFTFNNLRYFVRATKPFLNLVEKIFKRRKIAYDYILNLMLERLRDLFIQGKFTKRNTLSAWQILLFLDELQILNIKKGGKYVMTDSLIKNEVKEKTELFFQQFENTFDLPEKKAVFLTGVLVQFLLSIQRQDRGSDPFRKKLKGLKMRKQDILKVFPEAQNKLEEYGKNYYHQLEQVIAEYFVQCGESWDMSDDQINFYFLLGMDLADAKLKDGQPVFKARNEANIEQ